MRVGELPWCMVVFGIGRINQLGRAGKLVLVVWAQEGWRVDETSYIPLSYLGI